eukprot:364820-Chlamydomonas_euryale.AAC.4
MRTDSPCQSCMGDALRHHVVTKRAPMLCWSGPDGPTGGWPRDHHGAVALAHGGVCVQVRAAVWPPGARALAHVLPASCGGEVCQPGGARALQADGGSSGRTRPRVCGLSKFPRVCGVLSSRVCEFLLSPPPPRCALPTLAHPSPWYSALKRRLTSCQRSARCMRLAPTCCRCCGRAVPADWKPPAATARPALRSLRPCRPRRHPVWHSGTSSTPQCSSTSAFISCVEARARRACWPTCATCCGSQSRKPPTATSALMCLATC